MNSTLSLALTIGIPLVYMIVMLFLRKNVMNKIQLSQQNALKEVREYLGDKKFEELLKIQRTYIDEYFDKHSEDSADLDDETSSETQEESKEETKQEENTLDNTDLNNENK